MTAPIVVLPPKTMQTLRRAIAQGDRIGPNRLVDDEQWRVCERAGVIPRGHVTPPAEKRSGALRTAQTVGRRDVIGVMSRPD